MRFPKAWLIVYGLVWCAGWRGAAQTRKPSSPDANLALAATIVPRAAATPLLRLTITNAGTQPVSLVTGTMTGSTSHPAASFRFVLEMGDHHQVQLACTSDECGWRPVAGSLAPYIIHLAPATAYSIQLPLDVFRGVEQDVHLCSGPTQDARLLVELLGDEWMTVSSDSQNTNALWKNADSLWKGKLSTSIDVQCP